MTRWDGGAQSQVEDPPAAFTAPKSSGLLLIWQSLKRFAATLMLVLVGGLIGGVTGGITTFYCYFIGLWIGAPAGFIAGGLLGWRTAPRDATLVFAGTVSTLYFMTALSNALHWDPLPGAIGAGVAGSVAALLVYSLCRQIPSQWRYYMAGVSSLILSLIWLLTFTRWLNSQGG